MEGIQPLPSPLFIGILRPMPMVVFHVQPAAFQRPPTGLGSNLGHPIIQSSPSHNHLLGPLTLSVVVPLPSLLSSRDSQLSYTLTGLLSG